MQKGMFLGAVSAEPVYSLLVKKGMGTAAMPPIETGLLKIELHSGNIVAGIQPYLTGLLSSNLLLVVLNDSMMNSNLKWITVLSFFLQLYHVGSVQTNQQQRVLKDYYNQYFNIGVTVNMQTLKGEDSVLLLREFNSITSENDLKMGPVHPSEDHNNWQNADEIVAFALRHHLK